VLAALVGVGIAAAAGTAGANVSLTQVGADPFTNSTSQHATEVEPDTFADHGTVVAAFQVGRFVGGGASDIGVIRSGDGGATWGAQTSLHITSTSGNASSPYPAASDASVAYDAAHGVWIVSSIPITSAGSVPTVVFNRSTDDGVTWGPAISMPQPAAKSIFLDKNWTVCDNHVASPFFGHCYTELDNFGDNNLELMSTSTDGGLTWSTPVGTAGKDEGIGGQPVVQPSGRVVVPFESVHATIAAFSSTDGGASWGAAVNVSSKVRFHRNAGGLRTSPLPSAEIAADGTVYVAWEDCRFRKKCPANDIVFSKSSDGTTWSDVARIPIDGLDSGVDHFIPGLGVDPTTSGSSTKLALTYYFYPDATCTGGCQLDVGYISSPDGGAHWSAPTQLAGPMTLDEIADTSSGRMVGDYISTSIVGGQAATIFAVGKPSTTAAFDEGMYSPGLLPIASAAQATRAAQTDGQTTGDGTGAALQALKAD
jgi:hypothetical protein